MGRKLVTLIAQGLGRDEGAARSRFSPDDSTLRILNYPTAQPESMSPPRTAEHEDSGVLTLIWSDLTEVPTHDEEYVQWLSRRLGV